MTTLRSRKTAATNGSVGIGNNGVDTASSSSHRLRSSSPAAAASTPRGSRSAAAVRPSGEGGAAAVRSAAIKAHEASVFVESHETSLVGLFKDITAGLLTSGVISILAGVTLSKYEDQFEEQGLTTLVPALIGMRGNIFGSMSAKLSTVVQEVGTAQAKLLRSINPNAALSKADQSSKDAQRRLRSAKELSARYDLAIVEAVGLSFVLPLLLVALRVIAPSLTGELGFEDYIRITAVCVLSGLLSGYIMLFAARELVFWSYLRGMNPDNVAAPFVTALGDMITLPLTLVSIAAVKMLTSSLQLAALIALLALSVQLGSRAYKMISPAEFWQMLKERLPVLLVCMVISFGAGVFLNGLLEELKKQDSSNSSDGASAATKTLIMLAPLYNAQGGSGGGVFASRISTYVSQQTLKRAQKPQAVSVAVSNRSPAASLGTPRRGNRSPLSTRAAVDNEASAAVAPSGAASDSNADILPLVPPPHILLEAAVLSVSIFVIGAGLTTVMVASGVGISFSRALWLNMGMGGLLSLCSVVSYHASRVCGQLAWDPDNVGVPVVCATMDLIASYGFQQLARATGRL